MLDRSRRSAIAALILGAAACSMPPQRPTSRKGPAMWRATHETSTLWLFGQIPLPMGVDWFAPQVQAAFDASEEVWFENPQFDPIEARAAIDARAAQGGPSLDEVIGEQDRRRLREALQKSGREANAFDALPLWQAYPAVSDLVDRLAALSPLAIPERKLRTLAQQAGKRIESEWSSMTEIMAFTSLQTSEQQLQLLAKTLDGMTTAKQARRAAMAWASGDFRASARKDEQLRTRYPQLRKRLVTDRNERWGPRLVEAMARNRTTFVCVGFGHLLGEDSLQSVLRRLGVQVAEA